eukprot:536587_1
MTILIPMILLFNLFLLFIYIKIRFECKSKKTFDHYLISYQSVFEFISRIIYLQLTYTFMRLFVCVKYEQDEYRMWYAGNVICYDRWMYLSALMTGIMVFIIPFTYYYVQLYYKKYNTQIYEKMFVDSILSYREGCCWYGVIDILRKGGLIFISILIYDRQNRAIWLLIFCCLIIIIHCSLMPYRWR